ncbi:sodium:solute symporter family protein [Salinibaculum salinum]|uniref:sodium:solute symporter family protein n=1 Tax=Salinibaculum salinum TaxID=3131996 RepID=UPI0030EB48A2
MVLTTAQLVFGLYLFFVLLIGVYASRFTKYTPADFYIADRTVGTVVLGLSLVATVLSAFTVFGIGATTTGTGLGAFSFLALAAVFYTLIFGTVGVSLFEIGKEMDVVTPSEYVRKRYDSPVLSVLYLAITGIFMVSMIAGQLIGGGVALDALVGIPYVQAILVMAVFMIVYIHIAGYRGVVWSDTVQSTVLFAVLGGVTLYVMFVLDSTAIARQAIETTPGLMELVGPVGAWTPLAVITAALAFTFGVPAYPHTIQRFFSARDSDVMRRSGFLFAVVAIPVYFFGAVLGVWSVGVIPSPENPDYVIPLLVETLMHPVVFGVAMAGATAAIMSTADSVALTMSSMVSRDLYHEFVAPEASDRREVRVTQTLLIGIILLGLVLAWMRPAGIFDIVAFAVVGFATTSAPVFLGVFWRGGTAAGGIASLILGPGITILFFLEYIPPEYTFGTHYGFVGVIIAYGIFVAVSLATQIPAEDTIEAHSRSFWDRVE